jgi:hypothetical protein
LAVIRSAIATRVAEMPSHADALEQIAPLISAAESAPA